MISLKKVIYKILVVFCAFLLVNSLTFANEIDDEELNELELQEIIETSTNATTEPAINSRAGVVILRNSKQILYGKKENERRAMASTTKIMTAIIALEHGDLGDIVEVSKTAAWIGGSRIDVKTGDKVTLHDLLYGLMLCSRK